MEGWTFPVEVYNIVESKHSNYLDNILAAILQIHVEEEPGDILVFLTGQEDIEDLEVSLKERMALAPPEIPQISIHPLYANLPS